MKIELVVRSGWYYAKIKRPRGQGRAIVQSLGAKTEAEAWEKVKAANLERTQLAAQGDFILREVWTNLVAGRRVLVRDAISEFKDHRILIGIRSASIEKEQWVLDAFVRHTGPEIGNQSLGVITTEHVAAFVNRPGKAKLASRAGWLQHVKGWLDYCVGKHWLTANPAIEVAVRVEGLSQEQLIEESYVPFTEAEVQKLLAAVPRTDFWHGAILLAYHFGLRLGTVATLEEGNIVANRIRVFTMKGGKVVDEPLTEDLIAWLDDWKKTRPASDYTDLFPEQATAYKVARCILSKQFKKILVANGIPEKQFHGLRSTATAKKWSAELDELGSEDKRKLMRMVAQHGYARVQRLLAHSPGSTITETYMPRA